MQRTLENDNVSYVLTKDEEPNLYVITYDSQIYYVEAHSMNDALDIWRGHTRDLWGDEWDGTEEPEQIALVHDEPVIRRP